MVGVPGRSKGCHTCRKRKIKCDEGKPTCMRCQKSGYTCGGYDKQLIFRIHATEPFPTNNTSQKPQPKVLSRVMLPHELSLIAFKKEMQYAFVIDNFVWSSFGHPWFEYAAQGKIGELATDASQAFSQTVFGKHHRHTEIELSGADFYGRTVRSLISEISRPEKPGAELSLVTILILLMHASSAQDLVASVSHMRGMIKLVELCGPWRFQDSPLIYALESCRSVLVMAALMQKRRTFLESYEWRTVPWMKKTKNAQNQLCDILVMVPGFQQDEVEIEETGDQGAREDLVQRVREQLDLLYSWRWEWEEQHPEAAHEVDVAAIHNPKLVRTNRPISSVLWFSSFSEATEIALYNTVLLCLLGILYMHDTQDHRGSVLGNARPLDYVRESACPLQLPGEYCTIRGAAIEICRAFEFQLLTVKRGESALFWLFPLGIAAQILAGEMKYGIWIKNLLGMSDVSRNYGTGKNAFGFGFYRYPELVKSHSF